jgi:hypothetical protein
VIAEELYLAASNYYDKNQQELKLKHGIRSLTAFMNYCLREYLKTREII